MNKHDIEKNRKALDIVGNKEYPNFQETAFLFNLAAELLEEAEEHAEKSEGEVRIVFDNGPGAICGRFVEAEDAQGRSVSAGEWHERKDGLWELRITELPGG